MKKEFALLLCGAILLTGGCTIRSPSTSAAPTSTMTTPSDSVATTQPTATQKPLPSPSPAQDMNALQALLPTKTGYQWQYFGFAEYAHSMSLKAVEKGDDSIIYRTTGEVADMSGGEADGDYSIRITYEIRPGVLTQQVQGAMLMDSIFPTLELLRAPLEKGAAWTQQQNDAEGRKRELNCKIIDISKRDDRLVYRVEYRATDGDYYELRELTEGIGITWFEKYLPLNNTDDKFTYQLFTEESMPVVLNYEKWLPQLGLAYRYFGLAEYFHTGRLIKGRSLSGQDLYEYQGAITNGTGIEKPFSVEYYVDTKRGTVTEKVVKGVNNTPDIHSKLHNLVVLKFPLKEGGRWSHKAKLEGKSVTVRAEIIEYNEEKGLVKVRYTAPAEGYYDNTYREERTFETGFGMTGFSLLLRGDIGISAADAEDPAKLEQALANFSFGYRIEKPDAQ